MNVKTANVVFSHGQESGPWGTKISALAETAKATGARVDSIDYRGIADPTARTDKLIAVLKEQAGPLVLVGSSMGGHVAASAALALQPAGVFLLAPAFYMPGFEGLTPAPADCPMSIVHGWKDTVVPPQNSVRFAEVAHCDLHLIDSDHRLTDALDKINVLFEAFLKKVLV